MKSNKDAIKEHQKCPASIEDEYILKETIGKGTFGKVKLGIMKGSNKKVAIKILEKSKIVSKDDLERVRRELDIISKCSHLNVIQTNEIINCKDHFYIIMEYCEGGELFNYIVKKQRLNEDEAAYFFYQLIQGLEYIHTLNVVHRDLKPENLLLSKGNVLKIIDFGLSNYYNGKLLRTPCGSPCYASPEMVSGNKYNGYYIDVWSTGIILFAMLCGYLPFEDDDNEVLFKKILQCRLQYPNHVSSKARVLLQKLLQTNPKKRIKLNEIKQDPFYLRGKYLFHLVYPSPQTVTQGNEDKKKEIKSIEKSIEETKYSPLHTENIESKGAKIGTKQSNLIETEANSQSTFKSSIKEKIINLQSFLNSKNKIPNYGLKTVSTNETGNSASRSNTISNELRNTISEKLEKRKAISPKSKGIKSTIESYQIKRKEITYPVSPLSSYPSSNSKNSNGNCSRINTEQDYTSIYLPIKSDKEQKIVTPSNKSNKNEYLTFRNTINCPNTGINKNIQLPISPKHPYAKPIITQPNFQISQLTERPNYNLRQSVNTSTNTSYTQSFFQNQANNHTKNNYFYNKIDINVNSFLPSNKTTNIKIPSSPIYFDYLNNKKIISNNGTKYHTIDKGSKFNLTDNNLKSYNAKHNYSNMNIERIHQRLTINYKTKENPIYISTESSDKHNKISDIVFSRNTASSNPSIISSPKKYVYFAPNVAKSTTSKQSLRHTLHLMQNKIRGFY